MILNENNFIKSMSSLSKKRNNTSKKLKNVALKLAKNHQHYNTKLFSPFNSLLKKIEENPQKILTFYSHEI